MQFLRCVAAEAGLLLPLLHRTPLGLILLVLGVGLVVLGRAGDVAALAAVVSAAFVPRGALPGLAHPTTPLAVAAGRWLCVATPAAALALGCGSMSGGNGLVGIVTAAAVAGCALPLNALAGRGVLAFLFLCIAVAGAAPPERLVAVAEPGPLRIAAASALELGPALWRYRGVAAGDAGAFIHALLWALLGVLLTSGALRRSARHCA